MVKNATIVLLLTSMAIACGTERWKVKTLQDEKASMVKLTKVMPVSALVRFPAPTRKQLNASSDTRFPQEMTTYRVHALLIGYKLETDEDYHLVLKDPLTGDTMIAEIPSPECGAKNLVQSSTVARKFVDNLGKAGKYRRLATPIKVEILGVGFFDFLHGQTGVAKNGFELHPVLEIKEYK